MASSEEKLEELVPLSPKRRGVRGKLVKSLDTENVSYKESSSQFFSACMRGRTRRNGLRLKQRRFGLDIQQNFLTEQVVKHWGRLATEMVESPSLGPRNIRADIHLSGTV